MSRHKVTELKCVGPLSYSQQLPRNVVVSRTFVIFSLQFQHFTIYGSGNLIWRKLMQKNALLCMRGASCE